MKKILITAAALSILSIGQSFAEGVDNIKPHAHDTHQCKFIEFGKIQDCQVYSVDNMPQDIKTSTSSVEIINLKDANNDQKVTLNELLDDHTGITTQDLGSAGMTSSIRIRGWSRVGLTLDGVKIDNPSYGYADLTHFSNNDLERIEIVKGPQGSIHGESTHGGLISLTTKRGHGRPKINYEQKIGTYATFQEHASFSGGNNSADYYIGISRLDTNGGMITTSDSKSRRDDYSNFTVSANLGKRLFDNTVELRNTFRYIEAKKNVGISENYFAGTTVFDPNARSQNTQIINTTTFSHKPFNSYDYNLKVGYVGFENYFEDFVDSYGVDFSNNNNRSRNDRLIASTQHNLRYKDIETFSFGYTLEHNNFNQNSFGDGLFAYNDRFSRSYTTGHVFFNNKINIKDTLIIKAGTGIEDSQWGTYGTPNVSGALVLPTPLLEDSYTKLRSSYGYSVNYPTPFQFGGVFFGTPAGNPDLRPEKCSGWDVGIIQSLFNDKVNYEFAYFDNKFTDLISWSGTTYNNISRAQTSGFENTLKVNFLSGIYGLASHTLTNNNGLNNNDIAGVPRNRFNFKLGYSPKERYNIFVAGSSASSRAYNNDGDRVRGFFKLALGSRVRLFSVDNAHVYLWGRLNNILNDRYEVYKGYKHPGISFLTGLQVKFNLPDFKKKSTPDKV